MNRKPVLALMAMALIAAPQIARALEFKPYSHASLTAANVANRPVVVDVHADWCPTCKKQKSVIGQLAGQPEYASLLVLMLDYDKQKAERKVLGVRKQSTLIAFGKGKEVGRSTGETRLEAISALFGKTLIK